MSVSYDGWESLHSIQLLRSAGVQAEVYSVDRSGGPYETLRSLFYQGPVDLYDHPILMRELEEDEKTGRANHPELSERRVFEDDGVNKGSKDMSDGLAGASGRCIAMSPPGGGEVRATIV